ncbi:MAG TPA: hypothetical protein PLX18_00530 [Anaerohalosphaeraceae bacterium]|nr:hypothetical protein [Anaerohalosphaeraceae bacterium]HQG05158.1 hypothetical protein [Anaerohalosphaeraceae bacterium]HQI06332.1 hypothetical protein [Anaerohalosphaeraceae bacterium]HQJ67049.1 hypothetical protein [Anaerohalosphaeraceae bacterium]
MDNRPIKPHNRCTMKLGNRIIMTIAGLLLAGAALLKFHEALTVYIPSWREHGIWESYEFFLFQIPLEFALGVWILSGVFRKASWLAAAAAFFAFSIITLIKGMLGVQSCGCFGRIHVDPWYTLFFIDIPIFLLLLIFPPKGEKLLPPPWPHPFHALAAAIPAIGFMAVAAPILVAFRPEFKKPESWTPVQHLSPDFVSKTNNQTTPAQPSPIAPTPDQTSPPAQIEEQDNTTSQPEQANSSDETPAVPQWPWLQYIDIADQLKTGLAVILMYHHDCPTCAQMIPLYDEYARQMLQQEDQPFQIAFVAIPPYHEGPVPPDTPCLQGRLSDKEKWAIMSPYVVALLDGGFLKDWPQGTAPMPQNILDEIFDHQ